MKNARACRGPFVFPVHGLCRADLVTAAKLELARNTRPPVRGNYGHSIERTMADEPETPDDDLGEVESVEPTEPDYYEVEDGYIVFPHGAQWFAETYDASAVRITMKKPGEIEIMDVVTGKWRKPSQGKPSGSLAAINGDRS